MTRWYIAILFYLILVCILLALRPAMLFQPDKTYRRWGMKRSADHSLFSIAFLFPLLAVLSYYLAAFYMILL
jgi:hypothetical protein